MSNEFSEVQELLKKCNLLTYYERFIAEGFDDRQSLLDATEADLIAMNVKRGHRRRLQREIATIKGFPRNTSLDLILGTSFDDATPTANTHVQQNGARILYMAGPPNGTIPGPLPPKAINVPRDGDHPPDPPDRGDTSSASAGDISKVAASPPTKRKYKRHPRRDKNAPIKPLSAYVMFAHRVREEFQGQNIPFPEMAKIVGERWKNIPRGEKMAIEAEASRAKDKYQAELAVYKTTDDWKRHQDYLKQFKAKYEGSSARGHSVSHANTEYKRCKIDHLIDSENTSPTASDYASMQSTSLDYPSSASNPNSNGDVMQGASPSPVSPLSASPFHPDGTYTTNQFCLHSNAGNKLSPSSMYTASSTNGSPNSISGSNESNSNGGSMHIADKHPTIPACATAGRYVTQQNTHSNSDCGQTNSNTSNDGCTNSSNMINNTQSGSSLESDETGVDTVPV